jgi:hypothetical protein
MENTCLNQVQEPARNGYMPLLVLGYTWEISSQNISRLENGAEVTHALLIQRLLLPTQTEETSFRINNAMD